ncbi:MAG TPA: hypothetical protein VMA95_10120 [Streptosporangiaceae bacterium]|nr:hypothetical protein [Streptosporangiaceae bacterium]
MDCGSILPLIKRAEAEGYGDPPPLRHDELPILEDWTPYLLVAYVFDHPDHFEYVTFGHCEQLGLRTGDLRALAVGNLMKRRPFPEIRQIPGAAMFVLDGDLESSLLLVNEIWSRVAPSFDGDLIAAVPARDILLVTGSGVPDGMSVLRHGIDSVWRRSETRLLLTKSLLFRDETSWRH